LLLVPLALFMAMPLIYVISTAFKPLEELFLFPPRFFVRRPTMDNFRQLTLATSAVAVPFSRYVFNTIFTSLATVFGTVLLSSMAAYPLSKYRLWGKNVIFMVIVSALMFSVHVTQIPRYLVVHRLGLIDTYAALIVPSMAGAYGLFLMKQFMDDIPMELLEAARMDGAGEFRIYWSVVMPLVRPAWATLVVFTFIASWNDYFTPLVFTRSESMRTLTLAVQTIGAGATSVARAGAVAAASFLVVLPPIAMFLIMQRQIMETMIYSGIKG
jgi:ABC-type glycerol-3-phosphate transport system permease component